MARFSRRRFLQTSSATALLPLVKVSGGQSGKINEIEVHITSDSQKFSSQQSLHWRAAGASNPRDCIFINPDKGFQSILGFGAALTDAACYTLNRLPNSAREDLFHELFHPSGMGLNVCRICIGSSDYAAKVYSYDEGGPDPEMSRFSIDHDREYIIPILKQARRINPDLFLLASPWSPPAWMKVNGSMLGGLLEKKHFPAYAKYFVKFLQAYEEAGIKVNAISIQNEVDTDQDARMPASLWGQEYETGFVAEHLGPALAATNLDTKIWIIDHNYNLWGRAVCELDDPAANKYIEGVAWHGYLGEPSAMTRVHNAHPEKNMYFTEGGPSLSPEYAKDWVQWSKTFSGILTNWAKCIIAWNLALDEHGKPNIGPFDCAGTITINSQTNAITYSGQYWAFAHFARAARPGVKRIDSSGDVDRISHIAFSGPNGGATAVLTNDGPERHITIRVASKEADILLPANSICSYSCSVQS